MSSFPKEGGNETDLIPKVTCFSFNFSIPGCLMRMWAFRFWEQWRKKGFAAGVGAAGAAGAGRGTLRAVKFLGQSGHWYSFTSSALFRLCRGCRGGTFMAPLRRWMRVVWFRPGCWNSRPKKKGKEEDRKQTNKQTNKHWKKVIFTPRR